MSDAQENATSTPPESFDVPTTLAILGDFLTDNGTMPIDLKRANFTIAGETVSGATFVSHVHISPADSYGYSNWNDFDYFNNVAAEIEGKAECPEMIDPPEHAVIELEPAA